MKKDSTITTAPAAKVLVICLVIFAVFAVGYLVGYGLVHLFN